MNVDDFLSGGEFLTAGDMQEGKAYPTRIKGVAIGEGFGGKQRPELTLHWPYNGEQDGETKLGLNATNMKTIAKLLNTRTMDDWVGGKIKLYRTDVQNPEGKVVPGIRVVEVQEEVATPPAPPKTETLDTPF